MPCEVIPRTVNNTHIAVELEFNEATENRTMFKPRIEDKSTRILSGRADGKESARPRQQEIWEESLEHLDEKFNPKFSQKKIKCQGFGYRTLPRMFSTLEDIEVIKETETAIDDVRVTSEWYTEPRLHPSHHESRRQSTSEVRKTELGKVAWLASSKSGINRRRSSEGSVLSGRRDFGLIQYLNDFRSTLVEQPSERKDQSDIGFSRRENNAEELGLVSNTSQRSSFSTMNTVPETREPKCFYSFPRRLSLPVQNHRSTEKENRNSVPVNSGFALDNDAEIQWERLVARARSFQMMTSKEPETMPKQEQSKSGKEQASFHGKAVDKSSESEGDGEDIAKRADGNLVNTALRRKSQEKTACPEKHVRMDTENTDDTKTKENPTIALTGNEVSNSGQVDLTVKNIPINHSFDNQHQVDKNSRRYSLATARPLPEAREKISGYSTHRALEYARILLGKIQTEGKSKTKKERLDDMSKALKMVLEELNRIELPDRELVSLFISLRAKIVDLKAELKAEEKDGQIGNDKDTESEVKVLSKSLPRARSTSESGTKQTYFRRFSWC